MHPHYIHEDDLHLEDDVQAIPDSEFVSKENINGFLYRIKVAANNETYYTTTQEEIIAGTHVIVQTKYGKDI